MVRRDDRARAAVVNGIGMGLVIVRSIVEAHGHSLGVSNADGDGARFYFRFPAMQNIAV